MSRLVFKVYYADLGAMNPCLGVRVQGRANQPRPANLGGVRDGGETSQLSAFAELDSRRTQLQTEGADFKVAETSLRKIRSDL